MLNSPGEEVASPPVARKTEKSDTSAVMQIGLIVFAGLYLFGMVWFYAHLPWVAVAGTVVAMAIVGYGIAWRLRNDDNSPR